MVGHNPGRELEARIGAPVHASVLSTTHALWNLASVAGDKIGRNRAESEAVLAALLAEALLSLLQSLANVDPRLPELVVRKALEQLENAT